MTVEHGAKEVTADAQRAVRRCRDLRVRWFGACVLSFLLVPIAARPQELIANAALPDTALTRNEALLYFTGRLQLWPNGVPVKVFVLPDADGLHRDFVKSVLGLYPYQLRRVWDRQVYSGTGQAPIVVSSEAEMIERVAATAGGVGYVRGKPADARVRPLQVH